MTSRLASTLVAAAIAVAMIDACRGQSDLRSGGQAYLAQCAVCHGIGGGGDGPLAASIRAEGKPAPAKLDHERVTALGIEGVRRTIDAGPHLRPSTMPVWGWHLGPEWTERIADYVMAVPSAGAAGRAAVSRYLAAPAGTPADGRRVYVLYCSGCHGPDGHGDGFFSRSVEVRLEVAPIRSAMLARLDDAQIEEVIGLQGSHAPKAETMPGWIHTLSPAERRALVGYVRSLAAMR